MTLYLNNDGSRWVEVNGRKRDMKFVLVLPDGTRKVRQADYYFAFGNFAGIAYRYREEAQPEVTGFWADIINAAMSEVNWHEIAEHYIEDVDKESEVSTPDTEEENEA